MEKAPLTVRELAQLKSDAKNLPATAKRKDVTLDAYDNKRETAAAKQHFELGCWLYYYSRRVYLANEEGLKARIDCARRLFLCGFTNPGYQFFTVFDFGERQFDTIFEMGDADEVIMALRNLVKLDKSGLITKAISNFGWDIDEALEKAKALGFETVEAMREHGEWLKKHGTQEYRNWVASILEQSESSQIRGATI